MIEKEKDGLYFDVCVLTYRELCRLLSVVFGALRSHQVQHLQPLGVILMLFDHHQSGEKPFGPGAFKLEAIIITLFIITYS